MEPVPEKYILYAEDDIDDRELVTEMMQKAEFPLDVICVPNGKETIHFLDGLKAGQPLPCCILLDVNMPVWNGLHTLEILKTHQRYNELPVFMFSSSLSRADHDQSLSLGAVNFIRKPTLFADMKAVCNQFSLFCQENIRRKQ